MNFSHKGTAFIGHTQIIYQFLLIKLFENTARQPSDIKELEGLCTTFQITPSDGFKLSQRYKVPLAGFESKIRAFLCVLEVLDDICYKCRCLYCVIASEFACFWVIASVVVCLWLCWNDCEAQKDIIFAL